MGVRAGVAVGTPQQPVASRGGGGDQLRSSHSAICYTGGMDRIISSLMVVGPAIVHPSSLRYRISRRTS